MRRSETDLEKVGVIVDGVHFGVLLLGFAARNLLKRREFDDGGAKISAGLVTKNAPVASGREGENILARLEVEIRAEGGRGERIELYIMSYDKVSPTFIFLLMYNSYA